DLVADGFQFVAVAGAQYQCQITNKAISPTLVVAKTTVVGVGAFHFDVTADPTDGANAASPSLLTATTLVGTNPANSDTSTLKAGEGYTVTEHDDSLWIPGALTCLVTRAAGGPAVAYAFNAPTLP